MHHTSSLHQHNFDIWNMPIDWFNGTIEQDIFRALLVIWGVSELLIWLLTSSGKHSDSERQFSDKGSVFLIILGFCFSIYASYAIRENAKLLLPNAFYWVGALMMAFGIGLRCLSVWTLKSSFTLSVKVKADQSLIRSGPYKYIRNPAYTGSILTLLGFAFVLKALFAPLAVLAICACAYGYRIFVEERALRNNFGDEYRDYCKHTWRLFPFIV